MTAIIVWLSIVTATLLVLVVWLWWQWNNTGSALIKLMEERIRFDKVMEADCEIGEDD